ncbi:uncharacterized protein LOC8283051 [Ricinus communis]|uniref:uncharacterized protein LOC8283051 n=1 Tax=Ricinus communis TaxID=3988 RepID=UPI00201B0933|nr:uncharacterized protein LOC8283051 [Ricinus communis]
MQTATSLSLPWSTPCTQLLFTRNSSSINIKNKTFTATVSSLLSYDWMSVVHYHDKHVIGSHFPNYFKPKATLLSLNCCFNQEAAGAGDSLSQHQQSQNQHSKGFWSNWKANSAEMSSKLAKLGLAAVLAYGLFDAITYTTFFVLAFLGYEKSTGKNPAANLQALLGIVILMWTGNNITRPFRVAGAAAVAPFFDRGLKKIQNYFKFPNLAYAFALVVSIVASLCLTTGGLLILPRWGK